MIHTTTALKRHLLAPAVLMLSMPLSGSVLAQVAQDSSTKDPVEMELNLTGVSHRTIHIRSLQPASYTRADVVTRMCAN